MRIDSIQLYRLPFDEPVESVATTPPAGARRESLLARLASGEHSAWGEVTLPVAPVECDEWSAGAFACLRDWLAPALVGRAIDSGEALQEAIAPFQGNRAAKCVLDTAWWALAAAARRKSLVESVEGTRAAIPVSRTIGLQDSSDALMAEIRAALAAGYDHVTLKVRPGWDVEMLRAVRQAFPAEPIAIDCDGGGTLAQQEMFYRLEDFFLKYIEQPLAADDLVAHAMLQENVRTPIALDQSVTSLDRAEQILDLGCCRILRVDLARVGGLTPALAIARLCAEGEVACRPASASGTIVARTAAVAFASRCQGALETDAPQDSLSGAPAGLPGSASPTTILTASYHRDPAMDEQQLAALALETTTLR